MEVGEDFDFQSSSTKFDKTNVDVPTDKRTTKIEPNVGGYTKDDFFDSISCDALDKQAGTNQRLRGAAERSLNTETFGAASLGHSRRGGRRFYRGSGRGTGGRGEGRGGGSGSYGGRGRGSGRGDPMKRSYQGRSSSREQSLSKAQSA